MNLCRHGQSLGAFSLLNDPIEILDATNYAEYLSAQLCADRYNVCTFGMSSCCNWQASSVSPNSLGGCDYQLVDFKFCDLSRLCLERDQIILRTRQ